MESDREQHEQALAEAERASVAPWVDYPSTPWWFEPAAGAWFAAMVLNFSQSESRLSIPVTLVLLGIVVAFFTWYRRRWGTWPRLRSAPREFRPAMVGYFAGLAAGTAAVVTAYAAVGPLPAAVVAFVAVTVLLLWYDHRYEGAARAARRRLS